MIKRIAILIMVCAALTGCGEKFPDANYDVTGSWHLTKYDSGTKSVNIGSEAVDIYIEFLSGGVFNLYQKKGEGRYYHYKGTWSRNNNIVSGMYSDYTPWACDYKVYKETGGKTLMMTANNFTREQMTLISSQIPDSVRIDAIDK
ncbi:MAG: hypothetical protein IJS02_01545 [Bacteroidales bacterium]|nr:hypothetical protein [Bacteroidales bacterium]